MGRQCSPNLKIHDCQIHDCQGHQRQGPPTARSSNGKVLQRQGPPTARSSNGDVHQGKDGVQQRRCPATTVTSKRPHLGHPITCSGTSALIPLPIIGSGGLCLGWFVRGGWVPYRPA